MVRSQFHIAHLSKHFAEFNETVEVLLLIERDYGKAMATVCNDKVEPYAHHTPLPNQKLSGAKS